MNSSSTDLYAKFLSTLARFDDLSPSSDLEILLFSLHLDLGHF